MSALKDLRYNVGLKYYDLKHKLEHKFMLIRLHRVYKYNPFYDSFSKCYRVFFKDRSDESGNIEYVVSEYIRDGLVYPFDIAGIHSHKHTFSEVLDTIRRYNGLGFKIYDKDKQFYSEQELNMVYKYVDKLIKIDTPTKHKKYR